MKSAYWYEHLNWNSWVGTTFLPREHCIYRYFIVSLHFCLILLLPHPQYSFILEQVLPYGLWEHHCSWVWFWINIIETHEHTSIHFIFHKKVILRELFCSFLSWQKDLNEKSHKGSLLGKNAKQIELICFRYSLTTFTHCFFLTFTYFQSYDQSSVVHTCNPSTREGRVRESLIFETA